ncbi:hypothetical protein KA005_77455, partial [bacterium]|nr:hypothetical protein [bacterium]
MKEPYIKSMPKDVRLKAAWSSVRALLAKVMQVPTEPFIIHVGDKVDAKTITTKKTGEKMEIASFKGLIQAVDNEELGDQLFFMRGVATYEAASIVDELKVGKSYEVQLALSNKATNILDVRMVDKKSRPVEADAFDNPDDAYDELFEHVDIADVAFKLSENKADLKIVSGNVVSARTPTSQKGNPYGRFVLIDDSMDFKDIKSTGGLSIFCDAAQVTCDDGSDIKAIGILKKTDRGVSMSAEMIVPLMPIPRFVETVEDDDDVPDIDGDLDDDDTDLDDEPDVEDSVEEEVEESEDNDIGKGSRVSFEDDDGDTIEGTVTKISPKKGIAIIEDDDEDAYEVDIDELVLVTESESADKEEPEEDKEESDE